MTVIGWGLNIRIGKIHFHRVWFLIVILLLVVPNLNAFVHKQDITPIPPFRSFTVKTSRGLPQSSVSALIQDDRGILWIGTMDGLGTFDGKEISTVPAPEGGPEFLVIYDLKMRRGGGIYVGCYTGVFEFNGQQWQHLGLQATIISLVEVENRQIWAVDQSGKVWFGRMLNGKYKWREQLFSPDAGKLFAVKACTDSGLVFAGSKGVFKWIDGQAQHHPAKLVSGDSINNLLVTESSTCWIGTTGGRIYHSNLNNDPWRRVDSIPEEDGRIESLEVDQLGRIWVGHGTGSVNFGNKQVGWTRWQVGKGYLPSTGIMAILADREGSIWFGLNGLGLRQLVSEEWKHRNFWGTSFNWSNGVDSPRAAAFGINSTRKGGLFVSYWGQGVLHWERDGTLKTYTANEGVTENNRFVLEPYPGVIWVCGRFTLFESRNGSHFKKTLVLPSGFVYRAQQSPQGEWYVNTSEHGIYKKAGDHWHAEESINKHLPDLNVRGMTWLHDGALWLATMTGIVVFKDGKYFKTFSLDQGFAIPRAVNCILEVERGVVWAAGFGGIGIWQNDTWRLISLTDGIPGKTIYSLGKAKDGSVWAGGSNGIAHYQRETWQVYTIETGLLGNECNLDGLHIDQDNDVWIGTMSALSKFDSHVRKPARAKLKTYWYNGFNGNGQTLKTLPRGKRSLKISWVAPWLEPQRVEYRTRIQRRGQNISWTFQKYKTEDIIERLDNGIWQIQVQARLEGSGEGGWTKPITAYMEIPAYWWETWWAQILKILGGIFFALILVVFRTRYLKKRQAQLKQRIDEAVAEIKVLTGLIPICAWCKKIRDDKGYWNQIEVYIQQHSDVDFSHSICPECTEKLSKKKT